MGHGQDRGANRDADVDALDAALIRGLQEDGRASIHHLAGRLGVSRDLVSHRLRMLTEREGWRVVAALDPGVVGHHVLTHSMVAVDGPVGPVARQVAALPDAVFVSMVSGALPLVVESRHGSVEELHAMLDAVRRIPQVRGVRVTTYAEILRGFFVAPQRTPVSLDRLDLEIVAILQQDGRISYRALGDTVRLSPSSTRARVNRLVAAGVIRIAALRSGGISRTRLAIGMGITATGDTAPIADFIRQSRAIEFAARAHGAHDFIATMVGGSSETLLAEMDELRALPEVGSVESWIHYEVVKEDYARSLGRVLST